MPNGKLIPKTRGHPSLLLQIRKECKRWQLIVRRARLKCFSKTTWQFEKTNWILVLSTMTAPARKSHYPSYHDFPVVGRMFTVAHLTGMEVYHPEESQWFERDSKPDKLDMITSAFVIMLVRALAEYQPMPWHWTPRSFQKIKPSDDWSRWTVV